MNLATASRGQKDFFEVFVKVEAKSWEECFDKLYEFVVKSRVAEIDACISMVTEIENKCTNDMAGKAINSIQLGLLRRRLNTALPILNARERALVEEALEAHKETDPRPAPARRARKKQGRRK